MMMKDDMQKDLDILLSENPKTLKGRNSNLQNQGSMTEKNSNDSQNESSEDQKGYTFFSELQKQSSKGMSSLQSILCSLHAILFLVFSLISLVVLATYGARRPRTANDDFVFACALVALISVIAFPAAHLLLFALQQASEAWLHRHPEKPASEDEGDANASRSCCLEVGYYVNDAKTNLALFFGMSAITLSFYALLDLEKHRNWQVPSEPGASDFVYLLNWAQVQVTITHILGVTCIYFGAASLTDILTSIVTRGLNVGNFASKIQTLLYQQLVIIKLTGGAPFKEDEIMYNAVSDTGTRHSPIMTKYLLRHCFANPFRFTMHSKPDDFSLFDLDVVVNSRPATKALARICYRNVRYHLLPMMFDAATNARTRQRSDQTTQYEDNSVHIINIDAVSTTESDDEEETKKEPDPRLVITFKDVEKTIDRRNQMDDNKHSPLNALEVWNFLTNSLPGSSSSTVRSCSVYDVATAFHNMYLKRLHFSKSLRDAELMKQNVHFIIAVALNVLVIFIAIAIFGYDINQAWLSFSSLLIASSFVFSTAASGAFASLVFLISVNPFDTGDIVIIDKDLYKILQISLLYTRVRRWDGAELNLNNYDISSQQIVNLREIGFWYHYPIFIDIQSITDDNMRILHSNIGEMIEKNHKRFTGKFAIGCKDVGSLLKTKLVFSIEHRYTEDFAKFSADVTKCHSAIADALRAISATYSGVEIGVMRLANGEIEKELSDF